MSENTVDVGPLPSLLSGTTPSVRHRNRSRIGQRHQVPSAGKSVSFYTDTSLSRSILQGNMTPIARQTSLRQDLSTSGFSLNALSPVSFAEDRLNISGLSSGSNTRFETMYDDHIMDDLSRNITIEDDIELISKKIFEDFQGFFQCYVSENEIFDLLESYEQVCTDFVTMMGRTIKSAAPNKQKLSPQLRHMLMMERNTWRLARVLFHDRLTQNDLDDSMDIQGTCFHDAQIIENLYKRDSDIRQCQLVIDWLEKNESDEVTDTNSNRIVDSKVAWENTFHALQRKSKNPNQVQMRPMVSEMDPDAPTRQNVPLHDLDRNDENEFFEGMFGFIRKGHLDKAQRYAEQCGYFWLSAALDGWRLHKDSNYNCQSTQDLCPTEGNPCKDIWKAHCWNIIDKKCLSQYESAIYASLSGHLNGLLNVCYNWEDALWAHTKVLLDAKIDEELQMSSQMKRPRQELPHPTWNPILTQTQIFQELKANPQKNIRDEYNTPHHMLQRHIILDTLNDGIEEMHLLISKGSFSHHLIRFFAHFILCLRVVGLSYKEDLCLDILKSYVQVLIKEKSTALIATYTATLPAADQVEIYAKFLEGIHEHSERQQCLELAEESGLDVQKITKTVVENIRNRQDSDMTGQSNQLTSETTQEDMEKIEAIDWLAFIPEQRAEAMKQANALMRVFVASQKLDAAEKVMARLPADSIAVISRHWKRMTGSEELAPEEDSICREYICFQAYLQALDAFNDWFNMFHQRKPIEPSKPQGDATKFTDWVAFEHKTKQYQEDLSRWKQSVQATTKVATDRLYNVLLFPDGGWMIDQSSVSEKKSEDACRDQQMSLLRHLCIPQVCSLLHKVLHDSGHFKEALQISDVVANEKNELYQEFTKEELRNFLLKMRESSLELLDQNLDPLGYPFQ